MRQLIAEALALCEGQTKWEKDHELFRAIGIVGDWGFGQGYGDVRHFGTKGYESGKLKAEFLTMLDDWIWEWGSQQSKPLPKHIQKLVKALRYTKQANDTLKAVRGG